MRRSSLSKLKEVKWVKVSDDDPLECGIIPSGATGLITPLLLSGHMELTEELKRRVCTRVFTELKGYTEDDGSPVENTIDARIEVYGSMLAFNAINNAVFEVNGEAAEGEADAASD